MKNSQTFNLMLSQVEASQSLQFIQAIEGIAFNFVWYLNPPINTKQTHNITLELTQDLQEARQAFSNAAIDLGLADHQWKLLPSKI